MTSVLVQRRDDAYPSPLRLWDQRSWIRSKPTRKVSLEGVAFPTRLVPLANHPEIANSLELQRRILAYRLLAHLRFTTLLELEHVNPVCSDLGRGVSRVLLSEGQKNDALRIYCDEGGHALFVELLAKEIEELYQIKGECLGTPEFHLCLKRMLGDPAHEVSPRLLQHFFVAVSETLVTKILRDIPRDPEVAPGVRAVIGDHANDEATHSVYFKWYFPRLWNATSGEEKLAVGRLLPDLVWAFLSPDYAVERRVLRSVGLSTQDSERVLNEVYDPETVEDGVREAARPTLEMFKKAGVFDDGEIRQSFVARKLL